MKRSTRSQYPKHSFAFVKPVCYSLLMLSCTELKWVLFFLHLFKLVELWSIMEELFSCKGSCISMVYSKIKSKIDFFFHRFQVSSYIFSVSCTGTTISVENRTTNWNNDLWIAHSVFHSLPPPPVFPFSNMFFDKLISPNSEGFLSEMFLASLRVWGWTLAYETVCLFI